MRLLRHLAPLFFQHRLTEMTYFVTSACNFRCRHCFIIDNLNCKHDELTPDELRKMGRHIPGLQRVHLGGGEPFTRSDIGELAVTIAESWRAGVICLPTNGWFTERIVEVAELFGASGTQCNLRLHFSLSTLPGAMDSFTGKTGAFERWHRSITAVKKITKALKNITVLVLSTFNDFNQAKFQELMRFVLEDVGVDDFSFCLVRSHGSYQPILDLAEFDTLTHAYYGKDARQNILLRSYREVVRETVSSYYKSPRQIVPCCAGRLRVVMSPDGNVYPCETLGYPSGERPEDWLMGNIRDFNYDIRLLLKSSPASDVKKRIRKTKCHCCQGIDLSLSLLCSNRFRFWVIVRAIERIFCRTVSRQHPIMSVGNC
jgi:radical SAM protein with 4Fe4S-binding SPASM domain